MISKSQKQYITLITLLKTFTWRNHQVVLTYFVWWYVWRSSWCYFISIQRPFFLFLSFKLLLPGWKQLYTNHKSWNYKVRIKPCQGPVREHISRLLRMLMGAARSRQSRVMLAQSREPGIMTQSESWQREVCVMYTDVRKGTVHLQGKMYLNLTIKQAYQ